MRYAFQQRLHRLSSRNLELAVASFCSLFRRPFLLLNKGSTRRPRGTMLISLNDSLMCSCILSSWEYEIPLNKLFTLGSRLLNRPPKGKHVLNRAESHRCEVNTLGILACAFSMVSQRGFILENRSQNLQGATDFREENF